MSARPNSTRGDDRLFTPAFIALGLADLAYFTAAGMLIALTPIFAAGPLGADAVGVGLTVGAFGLTALVLRPWAGRAADRRGRRPLLIGGALLCALAIAAHTITADLAVLVALRLVLGAAEAMFFVAGFAMLADLAPPKRAGEALSFNSLALYLGVALGPLLGERLLDAGGFTLAWAGAAMLALFAVLLAFRIPETGTRLTDDAPRPLIHRGAVGPSLALFAAVAGMAGFFAFVALYARDLGLGGGGPVLLVFGLVVVGCRVVFAKLPDRLPPFELIAAALAVEAAGLVMVGTLQSAAGLIAGAAVMAVGISFVTPATFKAISQRVEPSERGAAGGTFSVFLDLAFAGGPALLGVVAGSAGIPAAFLVAAVLAGVGAIGTGAALVPRRAGAAPS